MGFQIAHLWRAPVLNPINKKARSVPVLNPVDRHGRVFFFSWLAFMLAFWAWYTFPPLLTVTIKDDLGLTPEQVANSNIVSLVAALAVRFAAGPLCDRMGPRRVFGLVLLAGSVPVGLAPLVRDATGLYVARFFMGVLGGALVPCQVWCAGWFDTNVVGTATALAGGWGNAGGGLTYLVMPAVYDSLVRRRRRAPADAWRIAFVVPLVCLLACAGALLLLCDDTPTGRWHDRHHDNVLGSHGISPTTDIVSIPGAITSRLPTPPPSDLEKGAPASGSDPQPSPQQHRSPSPPSSSSSSSSDPPDHDPDSRPPPTLARVALSRHALFHAATYACSFGGELAVNAVLAAYYAASFPRLGQTRAAALAAAFGFLNAATRPLGGAVADLLYRRACRARGGGEGEGGYSDGGDCVEGLWLKKAWIHVCGLLTGALLILIGALDPGDLGLAVGLVVAMAVFHEAGNGANFALLPHVHPHAHGVLSGVTGAGGNLGGVVFAVVFRFVDGGTNYAKAFWIIGVIHIAVNLAVCWIPPVPRAQLGGR